MVICHHIDNDGYCAAAIIYNELRNIYDNFNVELIPHNYGISFDINKDREYQQNELVVFVDLSLDDETFNAIKWFIDKGCHVIHIDHHKSTIDYLTKMSDYDMSIMANVDTFYNMEYSGCMLSWLFCSMNQEQRKNPYSVNIEFDDEHKTFKMGTPQIYHVPDAVRYINDTDLFINEFPDSALFALGINSEPMTSDPSSSVWVDLLYNNTYRKVQEFVNYGRPIQSYLKVQDNNSMDYTHVSKLSGLNVLCLNNTRHSSKQFSKLIDEYDAVCVYNYDGSINKWRYYFYSNKDDIDLTVALSEYKVGGHKHACGCQLDKFIF